MFDPGNDVGPATWSIVECCVNILSACLPLYRPLYNYLHDRKSCSSTSLNTSSKPTSRPSHFASQELLKAPTAVYLQGSKNNKSWLDLEIERDIMEEIAPVELEAPYKYPASEPMVEIGGRWFRTELCEME